MDRPSKANGFSTSFWSDRAISKINNILKNSTDRVFLYAAYQTPHSPLMNPPARYPVSFIFSLLTPYIYML